MWEFETDRKSQCVEGVDFYHDLHPSMPMLPRIYPHRFGLATVQLLPKLRTEGEGAPELASKPDGPAIFNSMSWNTDVPADTVCNIYFFHEVATKGGKFERMNWLLTQYVEQHKAGEHLHSDNAPSSSQVFKWILGFENMF